MQSNRSIRNVGLTRDYHFRYLGLWAAVAMSLVVCCNVVLFLWIQEHFMGIGDILSDGHIRVVEFQNYLVGALIIETLVFGIGIVALAKLTAHRIAGPYLRLRRTFELVRDGKLDTRLSFRDYDHLDDVAKTFNEMLDALINRKPGS